MSTRGGWPLATQAPKAPLWMAAQVGSHGGFAVNGMKPTSKCSARRVPALPVPGAQDSSPSNLRFGDEFDEGEY